MTFKERYKKEEIIKYSVISILVVGLILVSIFVPTLYVENIVKNYPDIIQKEKIQEETSGKSYWDRLWSREYIVFLKKKEDKLNVAKIEANRNFIFFWKLNEESLSIVDSANSNSDNKYIDDILKAKTEGIGIENNVFVPGEKRQELKSFDGKYNIELINGALENTNEIWVNGNPTGQKNVMSMDYNPETNKIYYSRYTLAYSTPDHSHAHIDKIYEYNLETQETEQILDFASLPKDYLYLKTRGSQLTYITEDKVLKIINLEDKKEIYSKDISELNKNFIKNDLDNYANIVYEILSFDESKITIQLTKIPGGEGNVEIYDFDLEKETFKEV